LAFDERVGVPNTVRVSGVRRKSGADVTGGTRCRNNVTGGRTQERERERERERESERERSSKKEGRVHEVISGDDRINPS